MRMESHSGARRPAGHHVPRPRVCVGVSVHHATSATLFVQTRAAACRLGDALDSVDPSQVVPPPPVLDCSLIADSVQDTRWDEPPRVRQGAGFSASVSSDRVLPPDERPNQQDQGRGNGRTGDFTPVVVRGGVGAGMGVPAAEPVHGRRRHNAQLHVVLGGVPIEASVAAPRRVLRQLPAPVFV